MSDNSQNQVSPQNPVNEKQEAADWLLNRGQITKEEASQMLASEPSSSAPGINPAYVFEGHHPDFIRREIDALEKMGSITPEIKADMLRANNLSSSEAPKHDVDRFMPGARPEDYQLPQRSFHEPYTPEQMAEDNALRNAMAAAKLPSGIGSFIVNEAQKSEANWASMDKNQKAIHRQIEATKFEMHFGKDAPQKLELAKMLVAEIETKAPGFVDYLEKTGGLQNAAIISQLALHAERLYDKAGSKK